MNHIDRRTFVTGATRSAIMASLLTFSVPLVGEAQEDPLARYLSVLGAATTLPVAAAEQLPTAYSAPHPDFMPLERAIDVRLAGSISFTAKEGELTLGEYTIGTPPPPNVDDTGAAELLNPERAVESWRRTPPAPKGR